MKIKKNDTVQILSGKDKGKTGKVIRVIPKEKKIVVEGINIRKKHVRPKREGEKGEVVTLNTPFPASKAAVVCPSCSKPARIGFRIEGQAKKRFCKKCKAVIN